MRRISKITIPLLLLAVFLSACVGGSAMTASSWPGLAVDEETAYLAYNQHVYAINLSTGTEKWRYPAEADGKITFYAAPVLTPDGQLLVGSYNHILYSLNPQTGAGIVFFKEAKNHYIGSPLANEAGIFAPSADGHLYALDLKGNLRWPPFPTKGAQWAQPVADPECSCIYLTAMDHRIYAIDSESGKKEWETEDLGGAVVGTPAYSPEDILYVGTFNQEMLAIDAQSGRVLWKAPTDGWVWGGPAWKDGILYYGDLSGAFYAVEARNGKTIWKISPDGPIAQTPLLTEDAIYFTTQAGTIYALDYNGTNRWNVTIGGKLHTSPVLAGDKILVAPTNFDQYLVALDQNGTQLWQFAPEKK